MQTKDQCWIKFLLLDSNTWYHITAQKMNSGSFIEIIKYSCINRIWLHTTSKGWYATKPNQPNSQLTHTWVGSAELQLENVIHFDWSRLTLSWILTYGILVTSYELPSFQLSLRVSICQSHVVDSRYLSNCINCCSNSTLYVINRSY